MKRFKPGPSGHLSPRLPTTVFSRAGESGLIFAVRPRKGLCGLTRPLKASRGDLTMLYDFPESDWKESRPVPSALELREGAGFPGLCRGPLWRWGSWAPGP